MIEPPYLFSMIIFLSITIFFRNPGTCMCQIEHTYKACSYFFQIITYKNLPHRQFYINLNATWLHEWKGLGCPQCKQRTWWQDRIRGLKFPGRFYFWVGIILNGHFASNRKLNIIESFTCKIMFLTIMCIEMRPSLYRDGVKDVEPAPSSTLALKLCWNNDCSTT